MLHASAIDLLFLIITGIAIFVGAVHDLRTREVPDWLNYGLIFTGIGLRLIFSVLFLDASYIAQGLAGFGLALIVAYTMFYAGQWGGGDAKMLMGIGATVGFWPSWDDMLLAFIANVVIVGGFYGLCWSAMLAIRHRHAVMHGVREYLHETHIKRARMIILASSAVIIAFSLLGKSAMVRWLVLALAVFAIVSFYFFVAVKTIERVCMHKHLEPEKLTEGDWIAYDVVVDGKRICGPSDLGISKEQIAKLAALKKRKLIKTVLVKEGIAFVPSFFLAYLVTLFAGNLLVPIVNMLMR